MFPLAVLFYSWNPCLAFINFPSLEIAEIFPQEVEQGCSETMHGKSALTALNYRHNHGLTKPVGSKPDVIAGFHLPGVKVFTIGTLDEKLQIRFHHFEHAMV